ncbi:hypothetical protein HPB52_006628 [Rhipicephalus sanguineus]|uniref:Uncharacterized protein n=1 Tax=Rhipicephalus sanguineus TaxID=34632 RepID=A0A9D4QCI5_RHISA|nr:hypothetical protein HPB52_006628 [Rhipicephalus sanguineus]
MLGAPVTICQATLNAGLKCSPWRRLAEIRDALGKEQNSRPGHASRCSAGNAASVGGWASAARTAAFPGWNLGRRRPTRWPAVMRLPLLRLVPCHQALSHVSSASGPIVTHHLYGPPQVIS